MNASTALVGGATTLFRMRTTTERTEFGERLFKARAFAKLSQEELADRVHMRQTNLSHLERRGQGSPKVAELALACGVRVRWLATGDGPMTGADEPEDQAAAVAAEAVPKRLPPNAARDYRTIIHTLADSLDAAGITLTVKKFVELADNTYRRMGQ
jgi:transcriptional regulator with XRE-family HTH domain